MTRPSSHLEQVLEHLPFSIDDTAAANDAFRRWTESQDPDDERIVDLWTYCYVTRYFLSKSARGEFGSAAAPEQLIKRTHEKVMEKRGDVRNPGRYAHWVSVVCRNTFLNHVRRNRVSTSIDAEEGPTLSANTDWVVAEVGFVEEALVKAIDQLPNYLQEPARLYFLENMSFEEISEKIEKPVPTVRTYKHKAVKRLREDDRLQGYVESPDL